MDEHATTTVSRAIRRGLRAIRCMSPTWTTQYRAWAKEWLAGHGRGLDEAQDLVYLAMTIHHLNRARPGMSGPEVLEMKAARVAYAAAKSAIGLALGAPSVALFWARTSAAAAAADGTGERARLREIALQERDKIAAATLTSAKP